MTAEEFYEEHYEDNPNHFYTQIRGISVISPRKVQEAMEQYANEKVREYQEIVRRTDKLIQESGDK